MTQASAAVQADRANQALAIVFKVMPHVSAILTLVETFQSATDDQVRRDTIVEIAMAALAVTEAVAGRDLADEADVRHAAVQALEAGYAVWAIVAPQLQAPVVIGKRRAR